jgi:uncharacterized protein (DUF58 family)
MRGAGRLWLVPTRRFAGATALASLVVWALPGGGWWQLVAVNGALVVAAVLDALVAADPARLELHREVPPVLTLGGRGEIRWTVRNPTRSRVRVELADELAPSLGAPTRRVSGRVPPGARLTAAIPVQPARRGRFEPTAVTVRVAGRTGLGARQRTMAVPGVLRVHPPFRSRDEAELRITRARILEIGLRSARGRGGGTDFDQLREYSVDDEVRRIDWAATARSGRTMVRTYRAERNQHVLVLLDAGRTMAGRVAEVPRLEHAIDAAMCLTAVATRLGDRCGLVTFDRRVRSLVPAGSGRGQLGRVTEALYDLEPALVESDYAGAFAEVLGRFRRRALIVLLTDLVEAAVGDALLPALPTLGRHHLLMVAGVRDPDVVAWSREPPADAGAAYRNAAAVAELESRARVTARLRGLGATVVDAPPGDLAPRLADTYLDLKATGRL